VRGSVGVDVSVIVVVRETVSVSITASGVKPGGTSMIMRATTRP
jgi:hypothetical protein